jgi:hypothetical protein
MCCDNRRFTLVLAALLSGTASSAAPAADTPTATEHELAVWVPLQLTFTYRPLTTQYSCSGLEQRMKKLLLKLGARPDLEVRGYGCTKLTGPDPFAGVKINMSVLQPAGARPGLAAHWKRVDLLGDRETLEAASDCELIEQVAQKIVPLFTARNVDYHAACQPQTLSPQAVRLKADVLVADQNAPAASAPAAAPAR